MAEEVRRFASISECGTYRYNLARRWGPDSDPVVVFLMLNPSTATATEDDPTIRKCIGFTKQWSQAADGPCFGGILVVNLFAYRSTDPTALKSLSMLVAVGEHNRYYTEVALTSPGARVVCAWGATGGAVVKRLVTERLVAVAPLLRQHCQPLCLGRSADGSPRHPLMLSYRTPLEPWSAS